MKFHTLTLIFDRGTAQEPRRKLAKCESFGGGRVQDQHLNTDSELITYFGEGTFTSIHLNNKIGERKQKNEEQKKISGQKEKERN